MASTTSSDAMFLNVNPLGISIEIINSLDLKLVVINIPVVRGNVGIKVLLRQIGQQVIGDSGLRRIAQQVIALIGFFHQLPAQTVNRLALLVHHVVVFQQVFARFEVAAFDRLLRRGDALRNHLRFDGHTLLHPQPLHQGFDFVARENAHQIVFERKEESRRTRVALAAGASAQLVVDAARFVALSAEDVKSANPDDLFVLGFDDAFRTRESFCPLFVSGFIGIDLFLLQKLARHEIGIAAQQNVGTAAGHVGGDRYCAFASGLGHDLGFALVILGVQDVMRHRLFLQPASNQL